MWQFLPLSAAQGAAVNGPATMSAQAPAETPDHFFRLQRRAFSALLFFSGHVPDILKAKHGSVGQKAPVLLLRWLLYSFHKAGKPAQAGSQFRETVRPGVQAGETGKRREHGSKDKKRLKRAYHPEGAVRAQESPAARFSEANPGSGKT